MKVVVVAKTRMGQNICVGAVTKENYRFLRLIPKTGVEYHSWQPPQFRYGIGDILEIKGWPAEDIESPHVEDYIVSDIGKTNSSVGNLSAWIKKHCVVWEEGPEFLFDNCLQTTTNGKMYIEEGRRIPNQSVGFWKLPFDLEYHENDETYQAQIQNFSIKYVGTKTPTSKKIKKGEIARVSLARWWTPPDEDYPLRCYMQLSGWYT